MDPAPEGTQIFIHPATLERIDLATLTVPVPLETEIRETHRSLFERAKNPDAHARPGVVAELLDLLGASRYRSEVSLSRSEDIILNYRRSILVPTIQDLLSQIANDHLTEVQSIIEETISTEPSDRNAQIASFLVVLYFQFSVVPNPEIQDKMRDLLSKSFTDNELRHIGANLLLFYPFSPENFELILKGGCHYHPESQNGAYFAGLTANYIEKDLAHAIPAVIAALHSPNNNTKCTAATVLQFLATEMLGKSASGFADHHKQLIAQSELPHLEKLLNDKRPSLGKLAALKTAESIGSLSTPLRPLIEKHLEDRDPFIKSAAILAYSALGEPKDEIIQKLLTVFSSLTQPHPNPEKRPWEIEDEEQAGCEIPDWRIQDRAIFAALGRFVGESEEVDNVFASTLTHGSWTGCEHAVRGLVYCPKGRVDAVKPFLKAAALKTEPHCSASTLGAIEILVAINEPSDTTIHEIESELQAKLSAETSPSSDTAYICRTTLRAIENAIRSRELGELQ